MKFSYFIVLLFHQIIFAVSEQTKNNSSLATNATIKSNSTDKSENGNFTLTLVNIKTKDGGDNRKKEMLYSLAQNQYPSGGPPYGQFIPGGQGSPLPPVLLNALRQRQLQQQQSKEFLLAKMTNPTNL